MSDESNLICNSFCSDIGGDINIFSIYTQREIEDFRTIFDIFDQDKTGFVTLEAIKTILTKVGREPAEAVDLVSRMEVEADSFSFEDFLKIMKNLEGRLIAVKEHEH